MRLIRQQLRHGEDESVEQRPLAVDANHRLDAMRRGGRYGGLYDTRVYGVWSAHDLIARIFIQYVIKSGWEIIMTPVTYKRRWISEARRAGRLLRSAHELHAVLAEDLRHAF